MQLAKIKKLQHQKYLASFEIEAKRIVNTANLSLESKQIICASLFWCEGGKNVNDSLHFINSDPVMVQSFLKLLRGCFDIDESKFRALLHLHEYHDADKQLDYWSRVTSMPTSRFHKHYIKPHTAKRIHPDYPGCVSLRYNES